MITDVENETCRNEAFLMFMEQTRGQNELLCTRKLFLEKTELIRSLALTLDSIWRDPKIEFVYRIIWVASNAIGLRQCRRSAALRCATLRRRRRQRASQGWKAGQSKRLHRLIRFFVGDRTFQSLVPSPLWDLIGVKLKIRLKRIIVWATFLLWRRYRFSERQNHLLDALSDPNKDWHVPIVIH